MKATDLNEVVAQDVTRPRTPGGRDLWFSGGRGAFVVTVDGKELIDFDNAKGSVLLGHAAPPVVRAIEAVLRGERGVSTGPGEAIEVAAQRIMSSCGGETVAFFKTGTSAVRAVADAARQATGRDIFLSAGYHGYDPFWAPAPTPFESNESGVIDFMFDLRRLEELAGRYKDRIAAAVISPDHLYLPGRWYECAYEILSAAHIPVVADEVKQGYRYGPGLSVSRYGWEPAAATVSKGIANGHPLAAVVGRREMLATLRSYSYTSFFDPVSFAAAEATLELVTAGGVQAEILCNGDRFVEHCRRAFREARLSVEVVGTGNLFQFVCAGREAESRFYEVTLQEGLLFYNGDNQCPSLALSGEVVEEACRRMDRSVSRLAEFDEMRAEGEIPLEARYDAAWAVMDGLPDFGCDEETVAGQLQRLLDGGD